jgi:hypothetical protein
LAIRSGGTGTGSSELRRPNPVEIFDPLLAVGIAFDLVPACKAVSHGHTFSTHIAMTKGDKHHHFCA